MRSRIVTFLIALTFPAVVFAQSQPNAVAVFLNHGTFNSTSATDPGDGLTLEIKFDSKTGYGASYDRWLSPNLSAQILAQRIRGNSRIVVSSSAGTFSQDIGTLDLNEFDAALHWHFGSASSAFRPYLGGGVATIQGAKIRMPAALTDSGTDETFNLDNKLTWVADAGVNFRVSPNASIFVSAKYTPYSSGVSAEPGDLQSLKLDPLTYAAGVQWRF